MNLSFKHLSAAIAIAASVILIGAAVYIQRSVVAVSEVAERGEAERMAERLHAAVSGEKEAETAIARFFDANSSSGLTYLSVLGPSREVMFERGEAVGHGTRPGDHERIGAKTRAVFPIPLSSDAQGRPVLGFARRRGDGPPFRLGHPPWPHPPRHRPPGHRPPRFGAGKRRPPGPRPQKHRPRDLGPAGGPPHFRRGASEGPQDFGPAGPPHFGRGGPEGPQDFGPAGGPPHFGRGGPGGRKRRRRGHPGVLVFELVPTEATALRARATGLVWIAAVAAGLILLLSLAIQRADRHRRMLEIKLAEERHLAALGEMSAVLAHELKNPLTSLKGHTQLAIEAVQPDGASLKRKMNRVLNEALRIEEITNNLLDFIRSGNLHRQPSSVRTLIERSMRTMQNADTEIHLGEDIQWSFDLDRMQQVLINLLSNAEEAVDTAAKVDVSAKIIHQTLQIVVRDHGPGFAPGTEETSFEPFRTDRTRGTGLGLAICRRIVEAHGGQIVACNHPDGGAQLTLTIPKESTS